MTAAVDDRILDRVRAAFPALARRVGSHPAAYLDGPGGTQVPRRVADAMADYLLHHNANTHWNYPTSEETDASPRRGAAGLRRLLQRRPEDVSFGLNMTSITFHLSRALAWRWSPGDEIVITELDHHGNVGPWQAVARERGWCSDGCLFDPATGILDRARLEAAIGPRTRSGGDRCGIERAGHRQRRRDGVSDGPGRRAR